MNTSLSCCSSDLWVTKWVLPEPKDSTYEKLSDMCSISDGQDTNWPNTLTFQDLDVHSTWHYELWRQSIKGLTLQCRTEVYFTWYVIHLSPYKKKSSDLTWRRLFQFHHLILITYNVSAAEDGPKIIVC